MPKVEDPKSEDWVTFQLRGTQNVEGGLFNDWFTGYLNYQIEHHLFPNMPRHKYPEIAPRVQELCKKHGITYHSTTLWKSFVDVVDKLSDVSSKYVDAKN